MDTNQQNNIYVNSFEKGMCTDVSYDRLQPSQYVFAENLRITANSLLGQSDTSNDKHGILAPVPKGDGVDVVFDNECNLTIDSILAVSSIENIGAIIVKTKSEEDDAYNWVLFRAQLEPDAIHLTKLYTSKSHTSKKKFSVVMNKEREDIIKLYIATGEQSQILSVNLNDSTEFFDKITSDDQLSSYTIFPNKCPKILGFINGQLKTQQVQYCYRFYKKHGNVSKLSPKTVKIQIINDTFSSEEGCAEDTYTNIGVQIGITRQWDVFDSVQLFRLSYIKPDQSAEVNLIYDGELNCDVGQQFTYSDIGLEPIQQLSTEELFAMDGQNFVPQLLDKNQGYLFAANVIDTQSIYLNCEEINTVSRSYSKMFSYWYKDGSYTEWTTDDSNYDYLANKSVDINFEGATYESANQIYDKSEQTIGGSGDCVSWQLYAVEIDRNENDTNKIDDVKFFTIKQTSLSSQQFELVEDFDTTVDDYLQQLNITEQCITNVSYSDKMVSSIFRSLQRGETYRYGIVFYDSNGRKSEPKWIADIRIPEISKIPITNIGEITGALSLGIKFNVDLSSIADSGIIGYEIVRCEKKYHNSKILYSGLLSKPMQQYLLGTLNRKSPFYPTGFLTTDSIRYFNDYSPYLGAQNQVPATYLFQFFCPEMQLFRNDAMDVLSGSDKYVQFEKYLTGPDCEWMREQFEKLFSGIDITINHPDSGYPVLITYLSSQFVYSNKASHNINVKLVHPAEDRRLLYEKSVLVKSIKDVKNPKWNEGFSNLNLGGGSGIEGGIKQYKSFNTNISEHQYVNWVSSAMYDMKIGIKEQGESGFEKVGVFTDASHTTRDNHAKGPIGPGPQCFLVALEKVTSTYSNYPFEEYMYQSSGVFGSVYSNITHKAQQFAGYTKEEHKYDTYYGYGFRSHTSKCIVFDGDRYIVPCDYTTMYKAYDFNSTEDSLQSTQIVTSALQETTINTNFDYGMNYKNTSSSNLLIEPGSISGIVTQSRPEHQYNKIYSDNQTSLDVYDYYDVENEEISYRNRIMYSEYKTNGEDIDSFLNFKPAQFLDVDASYGQITQLKTVQNILFFWQDAAFGKLSVNERSLVKDQNSNDIMLGQSGILQRHDYMSTTYGMKEQDFSDASVDTMVLWVDYNNKAVLCTSENGVVNLGSTQGVQNIINERLCEDPKTIRDVQNNEILFNCFKHKNRRQQLVFNYQLNAFTAVYDRDFEEHISFGNKLFGLQSTDTNVDSVQLNYNKLSDLMLSPTTIKFVVNGTETKTFDTQEIVTENHKNSAQDFMQHKRFTFETNIPTTQQASVSTELKITDREGNIKYTIPRYGNSDYGNRVRGKWMLTTFEDNSPSVDYTISRVHTKFRTSFS